MHQTHKGHQAHQGHLDRKNAKNPKNVGIVQLDGLSMVLWVSVSDHLYFTTQISEKYTWVGGILQGENANHPRLILLVEVVWGKEVVDIFYILYVVDDHNDDESDDHDVLEYDESDDAVDLTRSKSSGKEVVIGRVPADGSDLQFLVSRDL